MFGKNTKYQIKTKNGYEDFTGIQKKSNSRTVTIVLNDGNTLTCTYNHKLMTPFGFVEVSNLYEGDVIETITDYKKIMSIIPNVSSEDVYDVLDAGKDHQYYTNGILSHNCEFIGSTNTLIHPSKLRTLVFKNPIRNDGLLDIYEEPQKGRTYTMCVDVAEGQGLDYSTFSVIDVTEIPYRQVAKYKNNKIAPMLFPTVIAQFGRFYNEAFVLVEINSIGLQVSDILHNDLAYENLIKVQVKGKQGQQNSPGFTKKVAYGLKTSKQTKMIGCTNLKALIESDKLIINDSDTIMELTTFSANKQSFSAEEGNNDDLVMTLVHFGWLTSQRYFKENVNNDIRRTLQEEQLKIMDSDLLPPPMIFDGVNNDKDYEVDQFGNVWFEDKTRRFPQSDLFFPDPKL